MLGASAGHQPGSQRGQEPFLEEFPSGQFSSHGYGLLRFGVGLDEGVCLMLSA
jgi:hypothetical protein